MDQLEEKLPPLKTSILSSLIGGGDGSYENPYTIAEMDSMMADGTWAGGCVAGMGYNGGKAYVGSGSSCYGYGHVYGYGSSPADILDMESWWTTYFDSNTAMSNVLSDILGSVFSGYGYANAIEGAIGNIIDYINGDKDGAAAAQGAIIGLMGALPGGSTAGGWVIDAAGKLSQLNTAIENYLKSPITYTW